MILEHLGEASTASRILTVLKGSDAAGQFRTPDLGGKNSTQEFAAAAAPQLKE